ncbi:hypothetical protein F4778DRAFT_320533 [Xylariomycetidae sp. FL2044]|nr:hypothetical protein F4778DRAFT_320533 [Xylariomycetidae sp. FL2044]
MIAPTVSLVLHCLQVTRTSSFHCSLQLAGDAKKSLNGILLADVIAPSMWPDNAVSHFSMPCVDFVASVAISCGSTLKRHDTPIRLKASCLRLVLGWYVHAFITGRGQGLLGSSVSPRLYSSIIDQLSAKVFIRTSSTVFAGPRRASRYAVMNMPIYHYLGPVDTCLTTITRISLLVDSKILQVRYRP